MDTSCPNPSSMTTIVCALWKNKLYPWDGINTGEIRGKNFTVVVAGMSSRQPATRSPFPLVSFLWLTAIQAPTCTRGTTLTPCRALAFCMGCCSLSDRELVMLLEAGCEV